MTSTKNDWFCDPHPLFRKMNNRFIVQKQQNLETCDKFKEPLTHLTSMWTSLMDTS